MPIKVKPRGVRGRDAGIIPPLGRDIDFETAIKALLGTPNPDPRKPGNNKKRTRARRRRKGREQ
jgi:hypothetical protein